MAEAVIRTTGGWGLQSLQLGVNELASSLVIGKHVGSILTRSDDARIFDIIENRYDVHVRQLPVWLDNVEFKRDAKMFGEAMRPIKIERILEDVHIGQLQGFATFVTLCTRYVLSTPDIQSTIYDCLQAGLCGCLHRGDLEQTTLSYNIKPLITHFVQACKDADADSKQSQDARSWMAQLAHVAAFPFRSKTLPTRDQKAVRSMLCDMFDRDQSIADTSAKLHGSSSTSASLPSIGARVHDTMLISVAYVALAAAANGAGIVVQVMKANSIESFPKGRDIDHNTFAVRLWLTKPPEPIISVLRYSNGESSPDGSTGSQTTESLSKDVPRNYTVFGGSHEIAIAVANEFRYEAMYVTSSREHAITTLWSEGVEFAQNQLRWKPSGHFFTGSSVVGEFNPSNNSSEPLRWKVVAQQANAELAPQAVALSKALNIDADRLSFISRSIAAIVHNVHFLDTYTNRAGDVESDFRAALRLVVVAINVGLLHTITHSSGDTCNSYALSIDSVRRFPEPGILWNLLSSALGVSGIGQHKILWGASTLWGGATQESQGHAAVKGTVVGIVAPHCTVIMDILRDPEQFARSPTEAHMLMVCRGSVPMLPRSRHTGFVQTRTTEDERRRRTLPARDITNGATRRGSSVSNELIVTFEPVISDPSYGTFCCWCGGTLIYELNPLTVLKNLAEDFETKDADLRGRRALTAFTGKEADDVIARLERDVQESIDGRETRSAASEGQKSAFPLPPVWLAQEELLAGGNFNGDPRLVLFDAHGISSWLVCAAGAVDESSMTMVWHGNVRELLAYWKGKWLPSGLWVLIRDAV